MQDKVGERGRFCKIYVLWRGVGNESLFTWFAGISRKFSTASANTPRATGIWSIKAEEDVSKLTPAGGKRIEKSSILVLGTLRLHSYISKLTNKQKEVRMEELNFDTNRQKLLLFLNLKVIEKGKISRLSSFCLTYWMTGGLYNTKKKKNTIHIILSRESSPIFLLSRDSFLEDFIFIKIIWNYCLRLT